MGACLSCSPTEFCEPGGYECSPATIEPSAAGGGGNEAAGGYGGAAGSAGEAGDGASGLGGESTDLAGSGGSGDAGASGAAGAAPLPNDTCLPNDPLERCVLRDDTGIYVDPTNGDDRALGTRDAPLASAAKALLIASDLGKPVYLCSAEYDELLEATDAAVALRGGYTCPGDERGAWVYAAEERATIRPTAAGVVLEVRDVTAFAVSDVDFYAANGVEAGESSVAAFVAASTGVTFTRVVLRAGKGMDGADAVLEPFTLPAPESLNGNGADDSPHVAKECACPAGDTTRGGAAGVDAGPAGSGEPVWERENGGEFGSCTEGANGGNGTNAPAIPPGAGAEILGTLLPDGWHPASGMDGEHGAPGQGGGGAAGMPPTAEGTSGGGCGGCGGRGGPGGGGGGASMALLVLDSELSLRHVTLTAADAGRGGDGVAGQDGQAGGAAGTAQVNRCVGGQGGRGADGGSGGGGAGGVSAAVLMASSDVDWDSTTMLSAGAAGEGGLGGVPGVNDGINGLSRTKLVLDPS